MLNKVVNSLYKIINPISLAIHHIGAYFIALMMFLVALDVVMRYFLDKPIVGSYELSEQMLGIVVAFCLAYTGVVKGHIRVEVLVERLPQKAQEIIGSIMVFIEMSLVALLSWRALVHIKTVIHSGWATSQLEIPHYYFIPLLFIGLVLFFMVLLAQFLETLSKAVTK